MFASDSKILHSENSGSAVDPHIWMDVRLWAEVAAGISDTLDSLFPEHSALIKSSATAYLGSLEKLQAQVDSLIKQIPENGRVLITSHDAFRYFGKAYGMEVRGLQGISTVSEYGLRDISEMSSFIVERKIKAVFVETSVSSKSLESVISSCRKQGHDVQLGGKLFSDAMGDDGSEAGTYEGMILHNARTISDALK
jgi:manganese/zinc/iron transport system substrate-binding protein